MSLFNGNIGTKLHEDYATIKMYAQFGHGITITYKIKLDYQFPNLTFISVGFHCS